MKIVYKIFFFTMLLIIFTITFGIFSNKLFLNEYYLKNKQKDLISIAETLDTKKLAPVERKSIELNDEISYNFIPVLNFALLAREFSLISSPSGTTAFVCKRSNVLA